MASVVAHRRCGIAFLASQQGALENVAYRKDQGSIETRRGLRRA